MHGGAGGGVAVARVGAGRSVAHSAILRLDMWRALRSASCRSRPHEVRNLHWCAAVPTSRGAALPKNRAKRFRRRSTGEAKPARGGSIGVMLPRIGNGKALNKWKAAGPRRYNGEYDASAEMARFGNRLAPARWGPRPSQANGKDRRRVEAPGVLTCAQGTGELWPFRRAIF